MNAREKDISPVRTKSKLKKRRRQRESEVSSSCSLQSIIPSAATAAASSSLSDSNKKRCNNDPRTNENTIGGLGELQYNNSVLQKENNAANVAKPSLLSFHLLSFHDGNHRGLTDPSSSRRNNNWTISDKAPNNNNNDDGTTIATSKLSFIDEMDLTNQLSAIEKDVMMSSFVNIMDVTSELERAFASINNDVIHDDTITTDSNNTDFYHDVIGRIGPPGIKGANGAISIAFPRCSNIPESNNARVKCQSITSILSQNMNLKRQTCYGMSIPLSWCQFPGSQTEQNNNTNIKAASPIVTDVTNNQIDSVTNNELATEDDDDVVVSSPSLLQYQGRIRISSEKGATIREVFDIDESDYVIGKLNQGDERYFIEKRTLPAPPPDSDDDDDESDDEDCVAVVRYKIVLNEQHDCIECSHEFIERDSTSGKMVGWISDRGRLANDPYFILKELDVNA